MKVVIYFCLFCMAMTGYSQSPPSYHAQLQEAKRVFFGQHDPVFKTYDFSRPEINLKLDEATTFRQKASNKSTLGAVFLIAGGTLITAGALHHPPEGWEGLFDFTKPALITMGTIPVILSIPSFASAGKNTNKMKLKIAEASALLMR